MIPNGTTASLADLPITQLPTQAYIIVGVIVRALEGVAATHPLGLALILPNLDIGAWMAASLGCCHCALAPPEKMMLHIQCELALGCDVSLVHELLFTLYKHFLL